MAARLVTRHGSLKPVLFNRLDYLAPCHWFDPFTRQFVIFTKFLRQHCEFSHELELRLGKRWATDLGSRRVQFVDRSPLA
jgi:hypothetical protein